MFHRCTTRGSLPGKTDDELASLDVTALVRYGIGFGGSHRTTFVGDGAVGAAVALDRQGVLPRAIAFLAEVVRSGGTTYAAALPEPVPGEAAAQLVRGWVQSAASLIRTVEGDQDVARWLESVCAIMALRLTYRTRTAGPGSG
ncbi:hypothetical protein [Streptomyces inhibens]|uniref:hypothetical protein n=1 Tax=Streptomyces inhibens TaxID=2293571 RepID=UPI001EE76523|nr:hypothetical protein [Streptomyces inhibens]UKY54685.1 hypothetical protein KI385_41760 [Streptomyces inhibens]